jgi:hypothetical protein
MTAMERQPGINRGLLGEAGRALSENEYVRAIAGIGVLSLRRIIGGPWSRNSFLWVPSSLGSRDSRLREVPFLQTDLVASLKRWDRMSYRIRAKKIFVGLEEFGSGTPDPIDIIRILKHPSLNIESVILHKEMRPHASNRGRLRISALHEEWEALKLDRLKGRFSNSSFLRFEEMDSTYRRPDVLVIAGGIKNVLDRLWSSPFQVRAGHVLVLGAIDFKWREVERDVESLIGITGSEAISFLQPPPSTRQSGLLDTWVDALSRHRSYESALAKGFSNDSVHVMDLRFLRRKNEMLSSHRGDSSSARGDDAPVDDEDWQSSRNVYFAPPPFPAPEAAPPQSDQTRGTTGFPSAPSFPPVNLPEASSKENEAEIAQSRFISGNVLRASDRAIETRGFSLGQEYRLEIFIAPEGEASLFADGKFPEDKIDWSDGSCVLQVLFSEPTQWAEPMQGTIVLPRRGASSKCSFNLKPVKEGFFKGRITIYYQGRILQTALLETTVVASDSVWEGGTEAASLQIRLEAEIHQGFGSLQRRRKFDTCMLTNHRRPKREPGLTVAGGGGAYIGNLDVVSREISRINEILTQAAHGRKRNGDSLLSSGNAKLLCDLAIEGSSLYGKLVVDYIDRYPAAKELKEGEYLQIVSATPESLVPLEFVYELPPPAGDAQVCPNAEKALREGKCSGSCPITKSPASHVCPLGFWGMSKVIERHVHDPDLPKPAWIQNVPTDEREILDFRGNSLLAMSQRVPAKAGDQLRRGFETAWQGQVSAVNTWSEWSEAVLKHSPVLLLALPHSDVSGNFIRLEIGGDVIESTYITSQYVKPDQSASSPIVLLLGCDTMNAACNDSYISHAAAFRRANAALVLGTVATILGTDAAEVAMNLVEKLSKQDVSPDERFGESLRRAKREAVAESQVMAMCMVAFGDADWRLQR